MNPAGRTLSYGEQVDLERRIQDTKDSLNGKELMQGVNVNAPNFKLARKKLEQLESILSSQGVGEVSGPEREKIEKEERLLREDLQKDMPSWETYVGSRPKDGPRHDKIVTWINQSNSDPVRQQKIRRWKSLRRYLDPHNPKASHVNNLFKE